MVVVATDTIPDVSSGIQSTARHHCAATKREPGSYATGRNFALGRAYNRAHSGMSVVGSPFGEAWNAVCEFRKLDWGVCVLALIDCTQQFSVRPCDQVNCVREAHGNQLQNE